LTAAGLARFKRPTRLERRTELPRTASGKVQKAPLRAELAGVHT
jgi:non-ribosomal peptide synthetase component E (peptide arylation enzyme)